MVVFAFKCSVTYKIKSAISNPQKSFPEWWYDMTMCMKFALNGNTENTYFHKKKKTKNNATLYEKHKQEKCIISIFNIKHSHLFVHLIALIRPES